MSSPDPRTTTRLLDEVRLGQPGALESLMPLVYNELHGLAGAVFADQQAGHTLQPTALIHEAWLKLGGRLAGESAGFESRKHFFAVAARAMRQVLIDQARRRHSQKRGDGRPQVAMDDALPSPTMDGVGLVEFNDSLTRLSDLNPRHARIVELRVLGGLTIAETAEILEVSHTTIEADWFNAKAWLRTELVPQS